MRQFGPAGRVCDFPSKILSRFSAEQADTSAKTFGAFLMYAANYDPLLNYAPVDPIHPTQVIT
jgi:hypothetical protein